jgi:hypothetical protein
MEVRIVRTMRGGKKCLMGARKGVTNAKVSNDTMNTKFNDAG